jgi:hypothetical protein
MVYGEISEGRLYWLEKVVCSAFYAAVCISMVMSDCDDESEENVVHFSCRQNFPPMHFCTDYTMTELNDKFRSMYFQSGPI